MIPPKTQTNRRPFAMMLMVVGSVVISFGGLIVRNIEMADAWQINIYRSIAFVSAILIVIAFEHRERTISRIRAVGFPGIWAGVILGIAGVAFMQALTTTTVANTTFTMCAIPFITAGLARLFLKERLTNLTLIAMVLAASGVVIMVVDGFMNMNVVGDGSVYGNFMAIITAIGFAIFAIMVRANRHIDMLPSLLVGGIFVIVVSLVVSFDDLAISWRDMLLCFLLGGVVSGFGHWVFVIASRYLLAAELTLFMLFEFALGPLWVWYFIGETPTVLALTGGIIVIVSVVARTLLEPKEKAGKNSGA
ncbi:MAG: DMT family transporter [Rhizobiaceae bacterium]